MSDETVELKNFYLIQSTEKALFISDDGGERRCWIPRSQVIDIKYGRDLKDDETGLPVKEILLIEIPEWLAVRNELI